MNHSDLHGIAVEIEMLSQDEDQFCNNFAAIWHIPKEEALDEYDAGTVEESEFGFGDYILETGDNSSWTEHEVVEEKEDWGKYLISRIEDWISNTDEDGRLERCRWDLADPADYEADEDTADECVIVAEGCYNGYSPTGFVMADNYIEPMVFGTYAAAQEWIDNENGQIYYLSHNEASAPSYTIWEY